MNENDRWISDSSRWDEQAAYVPSPEQQHAVLAPQDGRSTSATDASSNRPATSTPESQQTSNTSYRESEVQLEQGRREQDSNDSFYWHSGRSSSDDEEEKSNETATATPGAHLDSAQTAAQYDERGLPARSTSLSPTPAVSYGASALGFGGPSDWEYFGDYEAEEVDDEELYAHKPRAELPADYAHPENTVSPAEPELFESEPGAHKRSYAPGRPTAQNTKASDSQLTNRQQTENGAEDYAVLGSKWSPSTTTPTTPRTNISRPLTTTEPMPPEDQRPDLDEVIRAWSDAPYVGKVLEGHHEHPLMTREKHCNTTAEASLASTPAEHVLGVDASLKDAPSMPKLPDTVDHVRPVQPALIIREIVPPDLDDENQESASLPLPRSVENHLIKSSESMSETRSSSIESARRPSTYLPTTQDNTNTISKGTDSPAMTSTHQLLDRPLIDNNTISTTEEGFTSTSTNSIQQQSDHPAFSMNVPPSRKERTDSPSSEFVRKRQMFESPSDKKSPSPVFPRKTLKDPQPFMGPVTTKTSGFNIDASSTPVASNVERSNIQKPPDVSAANLQHSNINQAESGKDARRGLENLQDDEPRYSMDDTSQDLSTKHTLNASQNFRPPKSRSSSQTPSCKAPTDDTEEAAEATEAQAIDQEVLSPFSRKVSLNSGRQASETYCERDTPYNSQEKTLSVQLGRTHNSEEDLQLTSMSSAQGTGQGLTQGQDHYSQSRSYVAAEKADEHLEDDVCPKNAERQSTEIAFTEEHQIPESKDGGSEQSALAPVTESKPSYGTRRLGSNKRKDSYADLDPWGRASLNRFAAMLREEARAETNRDKLNIFNVFTTRESRLRVVLYGTDDELILPQKSNDKATTAPKRVPSQKQHTGNLLRKPIARTNTIEVERSAKALPPLPPQRASIIGSRTSELTPLIIDGNHGQVTSGAQQGPNGEESQSIVEASPEDSPQYSPGGRPIVTRPMRTSKPVERHGAQSSDVPDRNTSMPIEGGITETPSPSTDAPMSLGSGIIKEDTKSAQYDLRPAEARSEVKNYLTNRRSVYRPFATQTMESMENAYNFGREPDFKIEELSAPTVSAPTSQYNPAALIRVDGNSPFDGIIDNTTHNTSERQPDLRRFADADFDPLLMVLPKSNIIHESAELAGLKEVMDAIPEDFTFIHASVVAWDAKIKEQRADNERQRHVRQGESEQHIDSLFDEHEIGYGDIAELESEFKRSEAARKSEEDRAEYQTFVTDVFNLVWTRLHYELDQLIPHYEQYCKRMNDTLAGKDMFEASGDSLALAQTMTTFLGLHQKLEIRHQKAFEAVLERDRRLKKTEISPWYTLSNIAKVKQLEKQFEDAEKKAIIEYCQQRDGRANRLMDVLDQNTLRGVGANQDYMEAIMKAVRRIASGRAFASVSGPKEPTGGIELVKKAKDITALLATSSEQIVQTFHVADMLLNSADYEVSVAKAKVAKADMATLSKLKEERAKEDQKLMRDLEHRLALIREDSRRTHDEIIKLILFLGVQNGRAISVQPALNAVGVHKAQDSALSGLKDGDHEARMQKALDEAKRRNAS